MIIDGKKVAEEILIELAGKAKTLQQIQGRPPKIAAVLVGDIGGSRRFLELKQKAAEKVGIDYKIHEFPDDISTKKLRKQIGDIAKVESNDGIIVELPLPPQINAQYILNAIPENKDADILSQKAQGAFFVGKSAVLPPSVEAVKIIFEKNNINVKGKKCAVFGYGLLVGKPIVHWLAQNGATVAVINEFTENPEIFSRNADIVVSGVGKANLIQDNMVKEGAIVIDFGYNINSEGAKLAKGESPEHFVKQNVVGDVEFDAVSKKASLITPVPGGVGPIVIAAVLKNLLTLLKND